MKLLVTGGCGFIGSNFVRLILTEHPQWQLTNVDLLTYAGNRERLADVEGNRNYFFERIDIADKDRMEDVFARTRPDAVVHIAAETHVDRSIMDSAPFLHSNVIGTQVILDACTRHKVNKMVHVSTDEVYGPAGPEESFDENAPLKPRNPYSATKAAADHLVMAHHLVNGLNVVITRSTNNYGPHQHPEKLLPLVITNCMENQPLPVYGDGMQQRDWLYVEDHCRGILAALEKGKAGEVYNLSAGCERPNLDIIKAVCRTLGKGEDKIRFVKDRPSHDRRYSLDSSKAENELGFKPGPPIEERLGQLVGWYEQNRQWWESIKAGEFKDYYKEAYKDRV
ncbi:MAG: dTDP-glucose 4,6-dehydratase [Deltaproteobacteria bacterium]|nr:dTDP-glucose 4,6-dehydratase [Deltaproteobacteria bacterium]